MGTRITNLVPRVSGQRCSFLENRVAFTGDEAEAHRYLAEMAAVAFSSDNQRHENLLRKLWAATMEGEFEDSSQRWVELGFQSKNPRTDFRGGGVLSLHGLCYLGEQRRADLKVWLREAQSPESEYLFAAACINICIMLAVQLRMISTPVCGNFKPRHACDLALKGFVRALVTSSDGIEPFFEIFACAVERLHCEWRIFCQKRPNSTLLQFGEVLQHVSDGIEVALCKAKDRNERLKLVAQPGPSSSFMPSLVKMWSRMLSLLLRVSSHAGLCCFGRNRQIAWQQSSAWTH